MTALAQFSLELHSRRAAAALKRLSLRPRDEGLLLDAREHVALARAELRLLPQNAPEARNLEKLEAQIRRAEERFSADFPREPNFPRGKTQNFDPAFEEAKNALAAARDNMDAAELGLNEGVIRGAHT